MTQRPAYREIEHTADVGLELDAPALKAAFEQAAASMFDLMCDLDTVGECVPRTVRATSREGDLEGLMVRWLTELLYVFASERLLLSSFHVRELAGGVIEADVAGEPYDPARHATKSELKAVTYHELAVKKTDAGWSVRVIFDT